MSSAKSDIFDLSNNNVKSFMYILQRIGPSTESCGTPLSFYKYSDDIVMYCTSTDCFLFCREDSNHVKGNPLTPY